MSDFISLPFLGLPAMFDKVGGGMTCLCASLAGPHVRAFFFFYYNTEY